MKRTKGTHTFLLFILHSFIILKRIHKAALIVAGILAIGIIGLYIISTYTTIMIYPEVWSQNSPYGASYEFKVNDVQLIKKELETGFISTLDRVVVTDTKGKQYELERDFNINEYSGEVTRRFVLYGPPDGGLPESGKYRFDFIKEGKTVLVKYVDYVQSTLGYPTEIKWERRGKDLHVEWSPPPNVGKENWYKIIIWNTEGTLETPISLRFKWDASEGLLEDVPFIENGTYQLDVAVFSGVGFAYSEHHYFIWDQEASPIPNIE